MTNEAKRNEFRVNTIVRLRAFYIALKRFAWGCYKSLSGSYKLPLPAFPKRKMKIEAFQKREWKVFIFPIRYMCIRANLKIAKNRYKWECERVI